MLKATNEVTFFDPIVEKGHIEFNELFRSNFINNKYIELEVEENTSFISYHFNSFINHFRLLKKSKDNDVFLLFNNLSLFLMTFIFRNIECYFVVHNNLDFAFKSKIHFFLYKRIANKVKLIYLEDRLKKNGDDLVGHKYAICINHPLIKIKDKSSADLQTQVFISSRNLTKEQLSKVCDLEKDSIVICNKKIEEVYFNNLKMGYIKDFDSMLNLCSKVYIIGDYKYRASGILYKVLTLEYVNIVFSDLDYFNEISKLKRQGVVKNKIYLNEKLK